MTSPHAWSTAATADVVRALESAPALAGALADAGAFFRSGAVGDAVTILEQLVRSRADECWLDALDFDAVSWREILEVTAT
ncbi:Uncharacterised protein (plasmid) [Tsukamurella tyrosinosolvens]|uniref:Uncharacterized protein n=1 Tax=Tsukamurella tyrosinosolvens TaxID=57704 RepID=A0A1H4UZ43_TSUTY|nr:hypothetical protein [Tsukamurella tyrosinosolvens]KXO91099.1 hypothetical protein AXK58_21965 [Tsukamurella tyrosinosolvens]SEC73975.1 hypothetical protein SAMN04489793_3086 [Tsukamurella tyrosinosolvens]VEH90789.1 Uncharacterised protein [Tsukamurella tyrosinosolvens]